MGLSARMERKYLWYGCVYWVYFFILCFVMMLTIRCVQLYYRRSLDLSMSWSARMERKILSYGIVYRLYYYLNVLLCFLPLFVSNFIEGGLSSYFIVLCLVMMLTVRWFVVSNFIVGGPSSYRWAGPPEWRRRFIGMALSIELIFLLCLMSRNDAYRWLYSILL